MAIEFMGIDNITALKMKKTAVFAENKKKVENLICGYKDLVYFEGDYSSLGQKMLAYLRKMSEALLWLVINEKTDTVNPADFNELDDTQCYKNFGWAVPEEMKNAIRKIAGFPEETGPFKKVSIDDLINGFTAVRIFAEHLETAEALKKHGNYDDIARMTMDLGELATLLSKYRKEEI